jgi:hypothetical protein
MIPRELPQAYGACISICICAIKATNHAEFLEHQARVLRLAEVLWTWWEVRYFSEDASPDKQ